MQETGRPRKNHEKHRTRTIACRITEGIRDAIYSEAEKQETTVTEIMNEAFKKYLKTKNYSEEESQRVDNSGKF